LRMEAVKYCGHSVGYGNDM